MSTKNGMHTDYYNWVDRNGILSGSDVAIIDDETLKRMGITKEQLDETTRRHFKEGTDYIDLSKLTHDEAEELTKDIPNGIQYGEKNGFSFLDHDDFSFDDGKFDASDYIPCSKDWHDLMKDYMKLTPENRKAMWAEFFTKNSIS